MVVSEGQISVDNVPQSDRVSESPTIIVNKGMSTRETVAWALVAVFGGSTLFLLYKYEPKVKSFVKKCFKSVKANEQQVANQVQQQPMYVVHQPQSFPVYQAPYHYQPSAHQHPIAIQTVPVEQEMNWQRLSEMEENNDEEIDGESFEMEENEIEGHEETQRDVAFERRSSYYPSTSKNSQKSPAKSPRSPNSLPSLPARRVVTPVKVHCCGNGQEGQNVVIRKSNRTPKKNLRYD